MKDGVSKGFYHEIPGDRHRCHDDAHGAHARPRAGAASELLGRIFPPEHAFVFTARTAQYAFLFGTIAAEHAKL